MKWAGEVMLIVLDMLATSPKRREKWVEDGGLARVVVEAR